MTDPLSQFKNVVFCEDVREEVGNKKSLMGVMGGDILVPELPAAIQIAIYFEFVPKQNDKEETIAFRLLIDEIEIAKASVPVKLSPRSSVATVVLPKGIVTFEKESTFRLLGSSLGDHETEIGRKKIILQKTATT